MNFLLSTLTSYPSEAYVFKNFSFSAINFSISFQSTTQEPGPLEIAFLNWLMLRDLNVFII